MPWEEKKKLRIYTFHAPFQLNVSPTWFCVFCSSDSLRGSQSNLSRFYSYEAVCMRCLYMYAHTTSTN